MTIRIFTFDFITERARADYPTAIAVGIFGIRFLYPLFCVFLRLGEIRFEKIGISVKGLGNI